MARYLTGSKVGLLVLLSLYVDSKIQPSSTIPVLSFLLRPLIHKRSASKAQLVESLSLPISAFRDVLVGEASLFPGRSVWDIFLEKMWHIEDLDALHFFLDDLAGCVGKTREELFDEVEEGGTPSPEFPHLSRNSPLGISVRRAFLEFTRLQFSDGVSLWMDLIVWREPSFIEWRQQHPLEIQSDIVDEPPDMVESQMLAGRLYSSLEGKEADLLASSVDDVERLMTLQVDHMQKTGLRVPKEIQSALEEMLRSSSATSSLRHYSKFLDAWKAADYTTSFDNLHRYFDYTMHVSGRSYYHYALLNMAFLYADFGCFREAIAAIHESISMARENKDMSCLNFSLSWLFNFSKEHPEATSEVRKTGVLGTDKQALAFIKSKAYKSGTWSLLSTTILSEARLCLTNGESIATAFENISKARYLNHTKNVGVAIGQQMVVESSLYFRLGLNYLQWMSGDIYDACYRAESQSQDILDSACRDALRLLRLGRYDDALAALEAIDPEILRVGKHAQTWAATLNFIRLRRALHRDDHYATRRYIDQARANATHYGGIDLAVRIAEVELELRRGEISIAQSRLEAAIRATDAADGDIHDKLLLMVLKAQVYDAAGVPQRGFTLALRAASMAYRARVLDVLYRAVGALCRVLLSLREFAAVARLMRAVLGPVLECEDYELAARSFSILADAHIGLAGTAQPDSHDRKEHITSALKLLDKSQAEYAKMDDIRGQTEVVAKRALVMRVRGDLELANDAAAKCLILRQKMRSQYEA